VETIFQRVNEAKLIVNLHTTQKDSDIDEPIGQHTLHECDKEWIGSLRSSNGRRKGRYATYR
jgi:hypothetical protein